MDLVHFVLQYGHLLSNSVLRTPITHSWRVYHAYRPPRPSIGCILSTVARQRWTHYIVWLPDKPHHPNKSQPAIAAATSQRKNSRWNLPYMSTNLVQFSSLVVLLSAPVRSVYHVIRVSPTFPFSLSLFIINPGSAWHSQPTQCTVPWPESNNVSADLQLLEWNRDWNWTWNSIYRCLPVHVRDGEYPF